MAHFDDQWWEPKALLESARAIMGSTPLDEFYGKSSYQPVREAIIAATFATRRPWNRDWQIRVVPARDRFPDVEFKCEHEICPFEIVEADKENRHRGEEYRKAKDGLNSIEHYDPDVEAKIALDEIVRVVRQKVAKNYSTKPHLLVYVNLSSGQPTSLYAQALGDQFGESFQSAWLLWQSETFRLWPNPAKIKAV